MLAAQHARQDFLDVIGQHARGGVAQTLAAGRRDVVGAAPDVHLLLAPFLARVVLVETDQLAVVALVERLVLEHRNFRLAQFLEHQIERALRADQRGVEVNVQLDPLRLELAAGLARFGDALVGEVDIAPAGEQVLQVPVALAVTHQHEKAVGHFAALSHLRNLSTPGHPSSNRAPASGRAPTVPRAARRARSSCGPRPCARAQRARPGRRRSRCARPPRCRRAARQSRCRRPCARRCGRRGWRPYACRGGVLGLPAPPAMSAVPDGASIFLLWCIPRISMSKELSSVLATRRVSAASRLTPRLILPDLTITALLAASLILASSAAAKPVVPMM